MCVCVCARACPCVSACVRVHMVLYVAVCVCVQAEESQMRMEAQQKASPPTPTPLLGTPLTLAIAEINTHKNVMPKWHHYKYAKVRRSADRLRNKEHMTGEEVFKVQTIWLPS